ncbi:MAG TPA: hypothetical protein VD994_13055 [Prosthecobacter sp.]|nr:hypothetical protein [Prosthecobacter sp.]
MILAAYLVFGLAQAEGDPKADLSPFSGEYTFNATCSDDDMTIHVTFHKEKGDPLELWRAEGAMRDGIRKVEVDFSDALAWMDKNGDVTVDARIFTFKIQGKRLEWLPNSEPTLYKLENGKLQNQ